MTDFSKAKRLTKKDRERILAGFPRDKNGRLMRSENIKLGMKPQRAADKAREDIEKERKFSEIKADKIK